MAAHGGSELEQGAVDVAGVRRSYWLARAPRRPGTPAPPLLIALPGSGLGGEGMAAVTGLASRGPAAGITVVFPDGWQRDWHPVRPPDAEPKLDDARFLLELTAHLEGLGAASSWPVFLAGLSHGARYAEHVARHGQLPVAGLFLVAGTTLESSRRLSPTPQLRVGMTLVIGTGDRTAPYEGGPLTRRGLSGRLLRRRAVKHGELAGEDIVVGAEALMINWAGANGITAAPAIEELDARVGDVPVTRKTWSGPGALPVTLYRVNGGGHGWPGGPASPSARAAGPVGGHLDATALLLDMAERETARAAGRPMLNRGDVGDRGDLDALG
jgi:polyhydroxybutyrate depolymerase